MNQNHWITVSTIGAEQDTVKIYDSAMQKPSESTLNKIACYHKGKGEFLTFEHMHVQIQPNGYDCGPYSVAFATALLSGLDPTQLSFKNPRNHMKECIISRVISEFPSSKTRRTKAPNFKLTLKLYCYCRGIEIDKMVVCDECDNWYHVNCVCKTGEILPEGLWFCRNCI